MDQVVCIDDTPVKQFGVRSGLSKGSIYTVVGRCEHPAHDGILLSEVQPPKLPPQYMGYKFCCWNPARFRPVKPTNIVILRELACKTVYDTKSGLTYPYICEEV